MTGSQGCIETLMCMCRLFGFKINENNADANKWRGFPFQNMMETIEMHENTESSSLQQKTRRIKKKTNEIVQFEHWK
jgi:hypothetical protein